MDDPLRANRELWDAWTKIHVASAFYDVESFRTGERAIRLKDNELDEIGPVEGRALLHLQCHFGLDTLSWARLGATVTGADFSEEGIAAARTLAADLAIPATFVVSNLYDLPEALDGQFDIVYTSGGVLGWLPDIDGWARVAAHFVRPGGFFYVNEIHPVANALENEGSRRASFVSLYPYWSHAEPLRFVTKGSYADPDAPDRGLGRVRLGPLAREIVSALVEAGLRIEFLHEFDFVNWKLTSWSRAKTGAGVCRRGRWASFPVVLDQGEQARRRAAAGRVLTGTVHATVSPAAMEAIGSARRPGYAPGRGQATLSNRRITGS
jgi:2-polyprenyl-3-methyl-5-hydroxy-6-metoxy-1,4-benzoquinol methylase